MKMRAPDWSSPWSSAGKLAPVCCAKPPPIPQLFFIPFPVTLNCNYPFCGEKKENKRILKIQPLYLVFVCKLLIWVALWQCHSFVHFLPKTALLRKHSDVRLGILSGDLHVTVNLHFSGLAGTFRWLWEEFFFLVRSKHRGVGLSGRWKAVNFGVNYGEADGCWQMYCPGQGLAAGSATRQGAKPPCSSQQAHGTREEEDKDVRTSNYTPETCEIGALEVLATNDAPRCCRGAQEKGEHSGGSEGLERRSPQTCVMGSAGTPFQGCTKHTCSYVSPKTLPAV